MTPSSMRTTEHLPHILRQDATCMYYYPILTKRGSAPGCTLQIINLHP